MRGHIRKRSRKSWTLVLDYPRDPVTGKRRQKWVTVNGSKREAEKELARLITEVTGLRSETKKITAPEFLDLWLEATRERVKPSTLYTYEKHVRQWKKAIGPLFLQKLTAGDIQAAMNRLTVRPVTKRALFITLRAALRKALKWGFIGCNPADMVDPPLARQEEMRVWTEEEIARFLRVARGGKYYCLFYLALSTGARLGELLGLQWRDIDFERRSLQITRTYTNLPGKVCTQPPKTAAARRRVPLDEATLQILRQNRKQQIEERLRKGERWRDDLPVFYSGRTGKPPNPSTLQHAIHKYARVAEVPDIRFHGLRHTHATLLLRQGVHPKIVSERLGHSSVNITLNRYSHVLPDSQAEAVKAIEKALPGGTWFAKS